MACLAVCLIGFTDAWGGECDRRKHGPVKSEWNRNGAHTSASLCKATDQKSPLELVLSGLAYCNDISLSG
jgi:hypothetical protein